MIKNMNYDYEYFNSKDEWQAYFAQLENEIAHSKEQNKKNSRLRKLKILLCTTRLVAPYALVAGLSYGVFTLGGNTLFYPKNERKEYAYTMTASDDSGKVIQRKMYAPLVQSSKELVTLFEAENASLEELFEEFNFNTEQMISDFPEEMEGKNSSSMEVAYAINKDDYVIHKETPSEILWRLGSFLWVTIILEWFVFEFRDRFSSFYYSDEVSQLKYKYPLVDEEELKRKLERKKSEYDKIKETLE